MPRQRFRCAYCSFIGEVWYPPPQYDAAHDRMTAWPGCPDCGRLLEPFPCTMNHDLLTGGVGLTVLSSTGDAEVTVSSLSEIRTIENESLRRSRNGEGAPLVFRGFSQNHSNRHTNSFAGTSYEKNKSERIDPRRMKTTQGRPITAHVIPESQAPKP